MILTITRDIFTDKSTTGKLAIDGAFFCYTLEDVVRDKKIYGETAIPYGEYKVSLTMSNRFKKILPYVHDVPGYEGVRIHAGNTDKDTHGCPLVGMTRSDNFVGMSKIAMQKLMQKLSGVKKITLIIEPFKEPPYMGACV